MQARRILIVDDEPAIRFNIRKFFGLHGYDVVEAETCAAAIEVFRSLQPDVAIVDCFLPDEPGIELVSRIKAANPVTAVIMLTGHESIDLAVRAIKAGAEQFLTKPVDLAALLAVIEKSLETQRLVQRQCAARLTSARYQVNPFRGVSQYVTKLEAEARKVLNSRSPILIRGETGVGKGVLARWLHDNGARCEEAFVDVNCAGLGRDLLDSEIFGHERGAFTGAVSAKVGLLEAAHRGTLFMDEIGDMDSLVQAKLLKALEEKRFRRLGEVRERQVDIQLIAATHADLERLVSHEKFRKDLYFRISAVPLYVTPLRNRRDDIPLLSEDLLARLSDELGCGPVKLSNSATEQLQQYDWPGNVRELRNVLERALLLSGRATLNASDLNFNRDGTTTPASSDDHFLSLLEAERNHVEAVLRAKNGRVDDAAHVLGLSRSALYQKLKKHKISVTGGDKPS